MNKIVLSAVIAAIIVIGGIGVYFSTTIDDNQAQDNTRDTETPTDFPYQFEKDIFSDSPIKPISYDSNDPIKFESEKEIAVNLQNAKDQALQMLTDARAEADKTKTEANKYKKNFC